jgi:hypothetical protein
MLNLLKLTIQVFQDLVNMVMDIGVNGSELDPKLFGQRQLGTLYQE